MSNPKWTPGPWKAEPGNAGSFHPLFIVAPGQNGFLPWKDEDAHLIAAAPELYEALNLARQLLQEHHSAFIMRSEHFVCPVCMPNPFFQIDSALAKARGEFQ